MGNWRYLLKKKKQHYPNRGIMIEYAISIKYMTLGYSAILGILIIYLVSLMVKWKRLKAEEHLLQSSENQ